MLKNNISEHISYNEAINSPTAIKYNIDNIPNEDQLRNMIILAEKLFEPIRKGLGDKPIKINSFFRSKELNIKLKGATNSQHKCNNGAAVDIEGIKYDNKTLFNYIKDNSDFDQLIWEFGNNNNPDWVHVSYVSKEKNRHEILKAIKLHNGTTKYLLWNK